MADKRDYYEILGIHKEADEAAIKKAYRKLAKKYHPDTNAGDEQAEQRFKEITEAYTILSDPEKKKMYDRFGHAAFDGSAANEAGYGTGGAYREYHFEDGSMDDIFGSIFGDIFKGGKSGGFEYYGSSNDGFGGSPYGNGFKASGKGSSLHSEVSVSFDEAVFGCDKVISLQSMDRAGNAVQTLKVHIPAGIESGKSIRLRGKGMPGINGGEPGDLLLKVKVSDKPGMERKGQDIYTTASIPFTTAVFGGEVRVPTLYGDVLCKIREGTQSGTKIRLRGKGVVSMKNPDIRGDQYVTVQIQVPVNLSPPAKQKLKEYEQACSHDRHPNHKTHAAG